MEGFWSASKQRQKDKGGGIVIYWKKALEVEVWEGLHLPYNLKHAGLERVWIKAKCKEGYRAVGRVYMPNKNNSIRDIRKTAKFQRILQVLNMDISALGDTPFELMGDFNAHPRRFTYRWNSRKQPKCW